MFSCVIYSLNLLNVDDGLITKYDNRTFFIEYFCCLEAKGGVAARF